MANISKFLKSVKCFLFPSYSLPQEGPNTLQELLHQFDEPKKEKTTSDFVRDYLIQETMAHLEIEMLKMEPVRIFKGYQKWVDNGTTFYDWVPCAIRPEVVYCSYGKN